MKIIQNIFAFKHSSLRGGTTKQTPRHVNHLISKLMKDHQYFVYIITNKVNTVFYIGVTGNLQERIWQHKQKVYQCFTARYDCNKLVYYEEFQWIQDAIAREKVLKGGSRQKKINLIVNSNPAWNDLSVSWFE